MKNFLHKIVFVLILTTAMFAFVACGDDNNGGGKAPITGTLASETEGLKFTSGTYTKFIDVQTDGTVGAIQVDVTYEGAATGWITTKMDDGDVLVTVMKNTGAARSAKVVISAKGAEAISIPVAQKAVFSSEIMGHYTPKRLAEGQTNADIFVTPTYTGDEPQINMSFMVENVPDYTWPITTITSMAQLMGSMAYGDGLHYFDFKEDGTIGAGYSELLEFSMENGFVFGPKIDFPNAETLEVLPVDAITYYTKDGKVYFAIDKEYLKAVGQAELEMDLGAIIDALLAQYPGLGIESTPEYYAIPLKYEISGNEMTLKVDREMMMPYVPLIKSLVEAFLPEGDIEVSLDPSDPETPPMLIPAKALVLSLIEGLFDKSDTLEIGIRMTK